MLTIHQPMVTVYHYSDAINLPTMPYVFWLVQGVPLYFYWSLYSMIAR